MSNKAPDYAKLLQAFPAWAGEYPIIVDKISQQPVPLIMNRAQLRVWDALNDELVKNGSVRLVILKARKHGISTLIGSIVYFLTIFNSAFHSVIYAQDKETVSHIFNTIYKYIHDNLAVQGEIPVTRHDNAARLVFDDRACRGSIRVLWASTPDNIRGSTTSFIHYSEAAKYRNFGALRVASSNSMPTVGAFEIVEGTANGRGNDFHTMWNRAINLENDFKPVFLGWPDDATLSRSVVDRPVFMSEDEEELGVQKWNISEDKLRDTYELTNDQLNWRRYKLRNDFGPLGREWEFPQEYPIDPREAFISNERMLFDRTAMANMMARADMIAKSHVTDDDVALKVGDFIGTPYRGTQSDDFGNMKFCVSIGRDGPMRFYREPNSLSRYIIGIDPASGETSAGHDWSVIQVIERTAQELRQVAVYRSQILPYQLGCIAVWLGNYYKSADGKPALLVPEVNKEFGCVLPLRDLEYPRSCIFRSKRIDTGTMEKTNRIGLYMTGDVRGEAFSELERRINTGLLEVNDQTTSNELFALEKRGGKIQAPRGMFDDCVMALVVALWGDHAQRLRNVEIEEQDDVPSARVLDGATLGMLYCRQLYQMSKRKGDEIWS